MKIQKNSNQIIDLVNKTHVTITKQNLVLSTQFILIAISGGQDSICLFFILLQLKNQWKWDFGVLYCNHFWQTDSFYTSSLIFRVGFIFSIPAYLNLPSENIFSEQKSRNWRYSQFKRLSYFYNYDIIFTGHTATDRIETIILNLIRGTSTRGLSTLNWIRPISPQSFYFSRSFCITQQKLANFTDRSNKVFKNQDSPLNDVLFTVNFCNHLFLKLQNNFFTFYKQINNQSLKRRNQFEQNIVQGKIQVLQQKTKNFNQSSPFGSLIAETFKRCVGVQNKERSFSSINNIWVYDDFFFLTLEKYRIPYEPGSPKSRATVYELKFLKYYYLTDKECQKCFIRPLYFNKSQVLIEREFNISTIILNYTNLNQQSNFYRLKWNLWHKKNKETKSGFINLVNSSSKAKKYKFVTKKIKKIKLVTRESSIPGYGRAGLVKVPVKLCFPKIQSQIVFKFYNAQNSSSIIRQKVSVFNLKPIFFSKKISKIIIKFAKVSYWAQFKQNFLELEFLKLNLGALNLNPSLRNSLNLKNTESFNLSAKTMNQQNISKYIIKLNLFDKPQILNKFKLFLPEKENWKQKDFFNKKFFILEVITFSPNFSKDSVSYVYQMNSFNQIRDLIVFLFFRQALVSNFVHIVRYNNQNLSFISPNTLLFGSSKLTNKQLYVFRPLLFLNRFDVKQLCTFWNLPVYPDYTNDKLTYYRNRVRKQLLPLLRFFFNPQIDKLFLQFAEIANTEQIYLNFVSTRFQQEFQIKKKKSFELNMSLFHFLPLAIRRRLLKQFLDDSLTKKVNFFQIDFLLNLINRKKK